MGNTLRRATCTQGKAYHYKCFEATIKTLLNSTKHQRHASGDAADGKLAPAIAPSNLNSHVVVVLPRVKTRTLIT